MDSMRMARILGWAGIIPLILANLGFWKGYGVVALTLGNMYAAIILGFLGAIHWGLAMNREHSDDAPMLMMWSVIPALWGFFALWWSAPVALALLILGFIAQWFADYRINKRLNLPNWFLPLRSGLTAAVISLLGLLLLQLYAGF
ncbi:DUF3429 domain-containing protein [Acidithiobacillus thiooxidans]|uniref:DUF3429 domain-containing protein n=1 Tax=Acidithiobacillus thiooxidans ATCC 19377 TaxID=637390 RepID=A0A543Q8B6_ACITH|nr:DUF3429 domain-containing protein [Acidithiobacillus thiooxidans]MDR7927677.1 DUF3429 domain-containing protein [Acidithiobacillus thiooxidans]MDX5935932.1 DUF3429 domain-containing protein [Acidithiobacillus thiooxidans]TQN52565.1 hypothetical protein DLNHIDIE_02457 [Acidithiobacillus thiooxidans ATCC 19377]